MKRQISLRQANQGFSRYIAQVERGQEFIVTRRGQAVALLSPAQKRTAGRLSAQREAALVRLFSSARPLGIRKWRRTDLYDDA
jgi:prevent-host-death family protein